MKSILQEDSSVLKAIEKAWNNTGKPTKFTIQVIDMEEKNFFGIVTKPALISLVCDPGSLSKKITKTKVTEEKRGRVIKKVEVIPKEKLLDRFFKKDEGKGVKDFKNSKMKITTRESERKPVRRIIDWKNEYVDDSIKWLSELLNIMGIRTKIDAKVDQKMLNIFLQDSIFEDVDAQKMLFINLSNIVMQFLKKKYKKRFSNYYLIIKQKNEGKKDSATNK